MKRKLLLGIAGLVGGLLLFVGAKNLVDTLMGNSAQSVRVNYTSPISFVSPVKATTTYGPEELVNGNLDTWVSSTQPFSWIFTDFSLGGSGATIAQSSTTTGPSSTYSARLENKGDASAYAILSQVYDCIIGETYGVEGYFMSDTASTSVGILFLNAPTYASSTQIWSSSSTWIDFNPSVDQPDVKGEVVSSTFAQNGALFTCPGSGYANISFLPLETEGQGAGKVLYVDDVVSYAFFYAPATTLMDFVNPSDSARMTASDYAWKMETTGGSGFFWFGQNGYGQLDTGMTQFDFTNKPALVKTDYANSTAAINAVNGIKELTGGIPNIDLVNGATTSLYVVPAGYSLFNQTVVACLTSFEGPLSGTGAISVGTNYSPANVSGGGISTSLGWQNNGTCQEIGVVEGAKLTSMISGDTSIDFKEINLYIQSPVAATSYVVTAYLFGTLIPN